MIHEFSRTELIFGTEAMERLYRSSVLVFGVGGVGSHCVEALARSGIGRLALVDNDTVSLTNLNRQSIAYHSTIGRHKTQVMKDRILDINPRAQVTTHEVFVLEDNLAPLIPKDVDYIIDAIDTVSAKLAIAKLAWERDIPLISSMGTGNKLCPEQFAIADISETAVCPLCRVMRRELKKRDIGHLEVLYSREEPRKPVQECKEDVTKRSVPGSTAFVPPAAGLMIAAHVVKRLAKIS